MVRIIHIILFNLIIVTAGAQEKLLIRTDKPGYHAGETIWFRVDVMPAGSAIAYIELLDSAKNPVLQHKIKLTDAWGAGSFTIPVNLIAGNYILRGYTNLMKNYGAESFFTKQLSIINVLQSQKSGIIVTNVNELSTDIKTNKMVYKKREKVVVNFPNARGTVSIYKFDSFQLANTTITTPNPTLKYNQFLQETKGNIVTGKVTSIKTGKPVPNANCYLSVIGPVNMFYTTTSDSTGNIVFEINNVYDDNQVVLQSADSNYRVEIDNGFSKEYTTIGGNTAMAVHDYTDDAVSAQVQLIYNRNKDSVNAYLGDTLPFYGYAEYNYLVDEYVKFSSVEDIFREYIRPVQILRRNGALVPIIFLDKERRLLNKPPFVLIDNVPIFNMQQLMGLNPAKILRIDVIDRPYWLQQQYYEGIISVTTKTKDPEDYLTRSATVQDYKGLQLSRNFYSPQYDTEATRNSRLPDFRNVLYWSPNVTTPSVELYTSDLPGEYAVVVQSINNNGELVNSVAKFTVTE